MGSVGRKVMALTATLAGAGVFFAAGVGSAGAIPTPPPPCPQNGILNGLVSNVPMPSGVPGVGVGACTVAQPPATGAPSPVNMGYQGGHVQVHPRLYLVYWGWGQAGAFGTSTCTPEPITEGLFHFTLPCDPDGAGKYVADFVQQWGGTTVTQVATQYSQIEPVRYQQPYEQPTPEDCSPLQPSAPSTTGTLVCDHIHNDKYQLAGVWVDNATATTMQNFANSTSSNPAGPTNTYWLLAQAAADAAEHFHLSGNALADANFIIFQPRSYSDPVAASLGYCAFHDYSVPETAIGTNTGLNAYYDNLTTSDGKPAPWVSYTNLPYQYNNAGCGAGLVNSGNQGELDSLSIGLGHEIEETATDPGAETDIGNLTSGGSTSYYGGWYDSTDPNENGDKCAYVGTISGLEVPNSPPSSFPGGLANVTGNAGEQFAVQSEWSNADNAGTGWCAGLPQDNSPLPVDPFDNYTAAGYPSDVAPSGNGQYGVPANTSAPSVSGMDTVGNTLTANPGSWNDAPTDYVYQWLRCNTSASNCVAIDGATSSTYTPTGADAGSTIRVTVNAANANGNNVPVMSAATKAIAAHGR